ncbi:NAD(P)-binding protein [Schizophyllum commune H4-8]|uniref:NmrA-like domain-containing protein n=1 Tax=Schizophyllum commune (strain H4-8 / FGSC 9210) TaxID=578458 RepID=D8PLY9_SCHCM|nr:NAD(P)-binding protein [Schizophyllum commune H4-8]KAI5894447.1 NAD(P)-binding protein [Schizophyllum commune H4-8]
MASTPKRVLVIGGTGAQGMHVVPAILKPGDDGIPTPYSVRVLTRDPMSRRAQELTRRGVECVQGRFDNPRDVAAAMEDCYAVFVNTDTYTVGARRELFSAIKIYEAARRTATMRHLIWSGLDYGLKLGNYATRYKTEHHDAKGAFYEILRSQPSSDDVDGLAWTAISSGVYMEMLNYPLCGPLTRRADGTCVFASPIGDGRMPMIALDDLGWWARYVLDNRATTSGAELRIASAIIGWDDLVETFSRVTGQPAVHVRLSIEEWLACFFGKERPIANEERSAANAENPTTTTIAESFSGFWSLWRDGLVKRDMEWVRSVHPGTKSLEMWMRETGYSGKIGSTALKNAEDGKARLIPNAGVTAAL